MSAAVSLGLEPGDVVRTSYGTGPYDIEEVLEYPRGFTLVLTNALHPPGRSKAGKVREADLFWINGVVREADGRLTSRGGADEVFVVERGRAIAGARQGKLW